MTPANSVPFAEHVSELRKRFMWILVFVAIGGTAGYVLHDELMKILQAPLHDSLYYSNPAGAFSFVMKLCVTFGLVVAIPAVSYHIFGFFGPIIPSKTKRATILYISLSVIMAALGICFAYFVSLPASLHFLTTFGNSGDIHALITADEYFSFVLTYIAGFAILFQVPLIIIFINRFKPLPPKKLMGATRYVIVISFIVAAVITPTPDPMNQSIMAFPIIFLYLISVVVVALHPRRLKQAKQQRRLAKLKPVVAVTRRPIVIPNIAVVTTVVDEPRVDRGLPPKPRLISDFNFKPRQLSRQPKRTFINDVSVRPRTAQA